MHPVLVQMRYLLPLLAVLTASVSAGGNDVEFGPWYVIGPFRDSDFGIVAESLEFHFMPEADALAHKGIPPSAEDLSYAEAPLENTQYRAQMGEA